MKPYKYLKWNAYSGIIAPFLIIIVSFAILLPNTKYTGLYTTPFYILIIITSSSLLFWIFRFASIYQNKLKKHTLVIGYISFSVGLISGMLLLVITIYKLFFSDLFLIKQFNYPTDYVYWLITFWALVEGVHHYIFPLLYVREKSKKYSGAIGIQLQKLKFELAKIVKK